MNQSFLKRSAETLLLLAGAWILYTACWEFYNIAWGSGIWLGQFSFKWALAFFSFVLFCVFCLAASASILWIPYKFTTFFDRLAEFRERLGVVRWVIVILILIAPVGLLQYTFYGAVLGPYLRILLWILATILLGSLLTQRTRELLTWP